MGVKRLVNSVGEKIAANMQSIICSSETKTTTAFSKVEEVATAVCVCTHKTRFKTHRSVYSCQYITSVS